MIYQPIPKVMAINQLDQVKDLFTVLEEATPRWIHNS